MTASQLPATSPGTAQILRSDRPGPTAFASRMPFRWRILLSVAGASLLAWLLAVVLGVLDAKRRATIETRSNIDLWQIFISAKASGYSPDMGIEYIQAQIARELRYLRHVRFAVLDLKGVPLEAPETLPRIAQIEDERDQTIAPAWFEALVQPVPESREFPLWVGSRMLGTVRLTAKPGDEIAESWELLRQVALLWMASSLVMMTGLYFLLGRLLRPLTRFAAGMRELEDGHYGFRVPPPRLQELAPIAQNFNKLAHALELAHQDNSRLYRELIAVQEDERRQIAADLHDEFGPCLFGISANISAIDRSARQIAEPAATDILRSAGEISLINERLKTTNRTLLAKLRPAALGQITVAELLSGLISSFERRHPDISFERALDGLPKALGEARELTLYRCLQEGLTNALRHSGATRIEIRLSLTGGESGRKPAAVLAAPGRQIELSITDNGRGFANKAPLGFGLSVMRERIRALSGTLDIVPADPSGTRLRIRIPMIASS